MVESMGRRIEAHADMSAWLADQSDDELISLIQQAEAHEGWGTNRTLTIGTAKVFCKSIPLTETQADNAYSTANLHQLPVFYHYGIGSAGINPFRELAVHDKATQWVLDGETANVPLLHHHRILELSSQGRRMDRDRLDRYVRFWDGDERIRAYIEARNASTTALVTFAEWVPHTLQTWLNDNQHRVYDVIEQINGLLSLLRRNDIVHFDAHLSNIVTDGTTMLLTDFGLALDGEFDLDPEEREFLTAHRHFDHGEILTALGLTAEESTRSDPAYQAALRRYRPVIAAFESFFALLGAGPKTAARYDDDALVELLGPLDDLEAGAGNP